MKNGSILFSALFLSFFAGQKKSSTMMVPITAAKKPLAQIEEQKQMIKHERTTFDRHFYCRKFVFYSLACSHTNTHHAHSHIQKKILREQERETINHNQINLYVTSSQTVVLLHFVRLRWRHLTNTHRRTTNRNECKRRAEEEEARRTHTPQTCFFTPFCQPWIFADNFLSVDVAGWLFSLTRWK